MNYTCEHCHDTGLTTISNYDGNGSDADDQPCPDCAIARSDGAIYAAASPVSPDIAAWIEREARQIGLSDQPPDGHNQIGESL
jgi:hypothetical protein